MIALYIAMINSTIDQESIYQVYIKILPKKVDEFKVYNTTNRQ